LAKLHSHVILTQMSMKAGIEKMWFNKEQSFTEIIKSTTCNHPLLSKKIENMHMNSENLRSDT